jgi:RNA polymerase sigma-70 factor (ECF subfamily)
MVGLGKGETPLFHCAGALYLLFKEGYHGASPESVVRAELCREAIRLAALLLEYPLGATPATQALAAFMCLHAARLPGRLDASGNLSPLFDQDRSRWDKELVRKGLRLLDPSARGSELSDYHLRRPSPQFAPWRLALKILTGERLFRSTTG